MLKAVNNQASNTQSLQKDVFKLVNSHNPAGNESISKILWLSGNQQVWFTSAVCQTAVSYYLKRNRWWFTLRNTTRPPKHSSTILQNQLKHWYLQFNRNSCSRTSGQLSLRTLFMYFVSKCLEQLKLWGHKRNDCQRAQNKYRHSSVNWSLISKQSTLLTRMLHVVYYWSMVLLCTRLT